MPVEKFTFIILVSVLSSALLGLAAAPAAPAAPLEENAAIVEQLREAETNGQRFVHGMPPWPQSESSAPRLRSLIL